IEIAQIDSRFGDSRCDARVEDEEAQRRKRGDEQDLIAGQGRDGRGGRRWRGRRRTAVARADGSTGLG
ncbi:hypothetical protein U1Q18_035210, partial [Sarracenia purpurea var. burkii]